MKGNHTENRGVPKKVFHRSRVFFIASAILIALLIVSVYLGTSGFRQEPSTSNLVCFTCRPLGGNQTYTIMVEVNVTDGINQSEAIKVANKVFERGFELDPNYKLESVRVASVRDVHGIWAVDFNVVYTTAQETSSGGRREHAWQLRTLHGYFKVAIYPFNQTVVYSN